MLPAPLCVPFDFGKPSLPCRHYKRATLTALGSFHHCILYLCCPWQTAFLNTPESKRISPRSTIFYIYVARLDVLLFVVKNFLCDKILVFSFCWVNHTNVKLNSKIFQITIGAKFYTGFINCQYAYFGELWPRYLNSIVVVHCYSPYVY